MKRLMAGIGMALVMACFAATMSAQAGVSVYTAPAEAQKPLTHDEQDAAQMQSFMKLIQPGGLLDESAAVRAEAETYKEKTTDKKLLAKLNELIAATTTFEAKAKALQAAITKFASATATGKDAAHTVYHAANDEALKAFQNLKVVLSETQALIAAQQQKAPPPPPSKS